MNVQLLIDRLVHQTTILVAQLATTSGIRAPLSHVANQVFLDLSVALEEQGVGRKVAADMFGMALRSYQAKIRRISESSTNQNITLWEAIFDYIKSQQVVTKVEVLRRFRHDDEASIKGILTDMVANHVVFQTGHHHNATYRVVSDLELEAIIKHEDREAMPWLVWSAIYQNKQLSHEQLEAMFSKRLDILAESLDELLKQHHVQVEETPEGKVYRSELCVIPMEDPAGWEAALFEHINTVFGAVGLKLQQMQLKAKPTDTIGGSTYHFNLWPGHPHEEEVLGLLRTVRAQAGQLRQRVTDYNINHTEDQPTQRVSFYVGQMVITEDQ